ncbi:MAG: efflux RND transporter periplasmic adaptor subunit [Acidobacteriota bacterium]|nr:efflux RND transporter periplasmic adaptor subunit [Acidobacteriota bacterium]
MVEAAHTPGRGRLSTLLRVGVSVVIIVVLMLWILGAFRRGVIQASKQPVAEESAAGLVTQKVASQMVPAVTEAVGTVQAEQVAAVTARVVANVIEMRVTAGQRVTNGETLVVLDDRDLRHRVEQAQDAVRSAEATLAQAQSDYKRDKPLFDQQVITAYDFEHTQTNLKTAEANYHRFQQAAREAEVNLSYAIIRSPFAGVVIDKLANLGDMAAPGKPLLSMYEQDRLWLEANVPEDLMSHIRLNELLTLRIDALNREMRGRIVQVVPSSDPASRSVVTRVHLSETKDILPGMFGRLLLPLKSEEVLAVPASALIRAGQLAMVDVVQEARLERRTVQLGRAIGDQFEVLSGLAAGETIVIRKTR